jgi:tetratricopeptide (TPR) repeat protein
MKKTAIALLFLLPLGVAAQKEIKPSVSKAEKALKAGKFDEAKAIIDVTTASQEFMVDKKGAPSKNAAKAWYLKGLIYAGIDTTKVTKWKSLEAEPYKVAVEAFNKSKEIGKDELTFLSDDLGLPLLNSQLESKLAQAYLNTSLAAYQGDSKDYKKAFQYMERVVYFIPNDTSMLMNAGVYFAPSAEEYDKALEYIDRYHAKGGKNQDAYIQKFSIYRDKKKDNDKALVVAKEMIAKFPNNTEFPKYELDMYIKMNRLPEAKAIMEKSANANPKDVESRYYLGVISNEMKNPVEAKKWFNEAIKVDPNHYDSYASLADMSYKDVRAVREERNEISGTKDADVKKRLELFQKIEVKLKESVPYWEKCEALKPNEESVLYGLLSVYGDMANYDEVTYNPKLEKLKKKMKSLKLEVD